MQNLLTDTLLKVLYLQISINRFSPSLKCRQTLQSLKFPEIVARVTRSEKGF